MIIFVPEKSFYKKINKWVVHKDFLIADGTERHDGKMKQFGNTLDADEMNATPSLTIIASDPDSTDAKIKRRKLHYYLDTWMNDDAFGIKLNHLVECVVRNYKATGEDLNVFIVLRTSIFNAYHHYLERYVNEKYGYAELATWITHHLDKAEIKNRLTMKHPAETYKSLKKRTKKIREGLHIEGDGRIIVDDDDM